MATLDHVDRGGWIAGSAASLTSLVVLSDTPGAGSADTVRRTADAIELHKHATRTGDVDLLNQAVSLFATVLSGIRVKAGRDGGRLAASAGAIDDAVRAFGTAVQLVDEAAWTGIGRADQERLLGQLEALPWTRPPWRSRPGGWSTPWSYSNKAAVFCSPGISRRPGNTPAFTSARQILPTGSRHFRLIVAMPQTFNASDLADAELEAEDLARRFRSCTRLYGPAATHAAVTQAMSHHPWAHFSCHGTQDLLAPSHGRLLLHDRPLTIQQITLSGSPTRHSRSYPRATHTGVKLAFPMKASPSPPHSSSPTTSTSSQRYGKSLD